MPTDSDFLQQVRIEPLDPKTHDRTGFSSGIPRVENFLKRSARQQQTDDHTRVQVAVSADAVVVGYYALNAHRLDLPDVSGLPRRLLRNVPPHGAIPAAYLSMLGVSSPVQGRGLGRLLMADAFQRVLNAATQIGLAALVLDVLDDDGEDAAGRRKAFYTALGFDSFPSQPRRMFITLDTLRRAAAR
ncbi:GNAT family N-acetyltransferase [Spiribacter sp. 221]|uniref:GNAT family N-acetyltransferase n=1 Tax=Spiribacter onubensis TaxID=3122420 RepID=UPI00349F559C